MVMEFTAVAFEFSVLSISRDKYWQWTRKPHAK